MLDDKYTAGLFDGEGWVRIHRFKKPNSIHIRYQVLLGINMTHRTIIEMIHQTYGGYIGSNQFNENYPNNRPLFGWGLGSQKAATFLRRIRPFLVVKADQVDVALELQHHIDSNPYNLNGVRQKYENREDLLAYRQELCDKIRALKKTSFKPFVKSNDPI